MKMMFSMLALVLSASFAAGCAVGAEDVDDEQALGEDVASAESELNTTEESLTCPKAGTCEKASQYCLEPSNPDPSWCDILTRCFDCGWPGDY
uniref:Lipoprotein n=1 Tax=Jahnella sp. MSr9139 TaxID=1434086 RepID=A0A3Q8I3T9_9BACT|nr:hypothetical protein [Jahnella sp. MSr9139]